MAEEAVPVVVLREDFYRDSFGKVVVITIGVCLAIVLVVMASLYLYLSKPKPTTFPVYSDWRVQPDIPVDQPYRSVPDMLQWVSEVLPSLFVVDFNFYDDQVKSQRPYFTDNGYTVYLNQLNIYANSDKVKQAKQFVNGTPNSAPTVLNQGLLAGQYAWWVQMPVDINYSNYDRSYSETLTLQVLVVRVPTLDNLSGLAIDNILVAKNTGAPLAENG